MKKPAFTLIEMMVTVALIMLMTVGSIVYFNEFKSKQELSNVVSELLTDLKLARNNAVTSQKPSGRVIDLTKVEVEIYVSGSDKKIKVSDGDGNNFFDKVITGSDNISVTNNCGVFNFTAFTGISSCDAANAIVISMTSEASDSKTIVIKSSGLIYGQ